MSLLRQPDDSSRLHVVVRMLRLHVLLRLARPCGGLVARALALKALVGRISPGNPLLMQGLTDAILVRRDAQLQGVLLLGMVAPLASAS